MFAGVCQREAGLGSREIVSLAQARELAAAMRQSLIRRIDPLESRAAERRANAARVTFGECCEASLASKESGSRNEKHRAQWRMTLDHYASALRPIAVADVSTQDVLRSAADLADEAGNGEQASRAHRGRDRFGARRRAYRRSRAQSPTLGRTS